MLFKKNKTELGIKGNIQTFQIAPWVKKGSRWLDVVARYAKTGNKALLCILKESGVVLGHTEQHNIIVTRGRSVLAGLLAGDTTYTGEINEGAVGTGVSPVPVNSSVALANEIYRNTARSQTFEDNICYIDFFYDATEVPGTPLTITEFANFIDGDGNPDSGRMFSYIAPDPGWQKTSIASLFVSCKYTIN